MVLIVEEIIIEEIIIEEIIIEEMVTIIIINLDLDIVKC